MRTNIVIDDDLMAQALKSTGAATKREVVELGLKMLVALHDQAELRTMRGELKWSGDLEQARALR